MIVINAGATFVFSWKKVGILGLLGHLVVIIGLLERINCFYHLIHLFDWLVDLSCIFQESLASDKITVVVCGPLARDRIVTACANTIIIKLIILLILFC